MKQTNPNFDTEEKEGASKLPRRIVPEIMEDESPLSTIPEEILSIIWLYGGVKTILELTKTNQTNASRLSYVWRKIYEIRFGKHPYWFKEEIEKINVEEDEKKIWKAYKNMYSWTNEAVSNIIDVDGTYSYDLQVETVINESTMETSNDAYSVNLKYGRERPKSFLSEVKWDEDGTLAYRKETKKLSYDETPNRLLLTFSVTDVTNTTREFSYLKIQFVPQAEKGNQLIFLVDDNKLRNGKFIKLSTLEEGEWPRFVKRLKKELSVEWDDENDTLTIVKYPHYSTMLMNHFFIYPLQFTDAEYRRDDDPTEFFDSIIDQSIKEYNFFILSLFFTENRDFNMVYELMKENLFYTKDQIINDVTKKMIFHQDSLEPYFTFPTDSCCVCAKPIVRIACNNCTSAKYCSSKCKLTDNRKFGHGKICTNNLL